ncbi:MAG: 2-hydroxymuconate tautomerase [Nitrospira sp.]|nr:2-hydroxymuconate tautomerase [Nitrospira sp.]
MPLITVKLYEGRTIEQKRELARAFTAETVRVLNCPVEAVEVIFEDVKKSDWAQAGKLASD